jgi:uncharacterized protein YycO
MSITNWPKKINTHLLLLIIVVLGVFLAWGMVKVRSTSAAKTPISISHSVSQVAQTVRAEPDIAITAVKTADTALNRVVASKRGTKYHSLDCPGAKTITEANKIYFDSPAEAETAGYTRAANCKTLGKPASTR